MIEEFLAAYPTDQPRIEVDDDFHDNLGGSLHRELHELYDRVGLGKFREGLLELVDPRLYKVPYTAFFGGDTGRRVPFLINAFGEPIAYKRIGPREAEISILHTYGPQLEVLAYDLADFFDRILMTDDGLRQVVNVSLFNTLRASLGKLRVDQVYGFDPRVLAEEGASKKADPSYFSIVDGLEHLQLLLRRAEEH